MRTHLIHRPARDIIQIGNRHPGPSIMGSDTRWNILTGGLAVKVTGGPRGHANSPYPSSREGHHSDRESAPRPFHHGVRHEVEHSNGRPCRQSDGRSTRTCELTLSIVPRGTSFRSGIGTQALPSWGPTRGGTF